MVVNHHQVIFMFSKKECITIFKELTAFRKGKWAWTINDVRLTLALDMRMMTYTETGTLLKDAERYGLIRISGDYVRIEIPAPKKKKTVPAPFGL